LLANAGKVTVPLLNGDARKRHVIECGHGIAELDSRVAQSDSGRKVGYPTATKE